MDFLSKEAFPFEQYAQEVLGVQAPEDGFDQAQQDNIYQRAVLGYGEELLKQRQFKGDRGRLFAQQEVINKFGQDARQILNVPDKVENEQEFLTQNSAVEFGQSINRDGVLDSLTRDELFDRYATELTNDNNFFRFESLREGGGLSRNDIRKSLVNKLKESADVEGTTGETPLSELNITEPQTVGTQTQVNDEAGVSENVARGTASGFTDVIGKAIEGIDTLGNVIGSKVGEVRFFGKNAQGQTEFIQFNSAEQVQATVEANGDFSFGLLGDLGESIQEFSNEIAEDGDENSVSFKTGNVIGQLAGFASAAVIAGPSGAGSLAVTSGTEFQNDDYETALLEQGQTFNSQEADNVALWGAAIGSLEAIPGIKAAGRLLGANTSPQLLKWLNDSSGGAISRFIKNGIPGAFEEGLQEVISNTATNFVASNIVAYDKDRNLWEGAQESAEVGGAAGLVLNGLIGVLSGRRSVTSSEPAQDVSDLGETPSENVQRQQSIGVQEAVSKSNVEVEQNTVNVNNVNTEIQNLLERAASANENGDLSDDTFRSGFEKGLRDLGIDNSEYQFITSEDGSVSIEFEQSVIDKANGVFQEDQTQQPQVEQPLEVVNDINQTQVDSLQSQLSSIDISDPEAREQFNQSVLETGLTEEQYDVIDGENGQPILVLEDSVSVGDNIEVIDEQVRLEPDQEISFEGSTALVQDVQYSQDGSIQTISVTNVNGDSETFDSENVNDAEVITNIEIENNLNPLVAPPDALLSIPDESPLKFPSVIQDRATDIPQSKSTNLNASDFVVENQQEPVSLPVANVNNRPSFDKDGATSSLEDAGYTVLSATPTTITSYKNGIVYTQKISRNANVDATIKTTVLDLDGVSFTSPNPSQQIAQSGQITSSSGQLTPVLKGVKINQTVNSTTLIDTASANELSTRLGGQVLINDGDLFVLDVAGDTLTIANENNNLVILKNDFDQPSGDAIITDGQHLQLIGDNSGDPLNLSLTTSRLENDGYKVDSVKRVGNSTTVKLSNSTRQVTLSKKGAGKVKVVTNNIQRGNIESVEELDQLLSLENSGKSVSSNPSGVDHVQKQSDNRTKYTDSSRITDVAVINEQGAVIANDNGADVQIVLDSNENLQATADNFLASTGNTSTSDQELINTSSPQSRDWDISQVEEKLEVLPNHIRRLINLSTDKDVLDANGNRVRGYFSLRGRNGPEIVIDARSDRHSLDDVLQTVAHELSHFSTESWLTPGMTDIISTTYDIIKPQVEQVLDNYIELYSIDIDNATDHQKYILVHEYLATLNTSLLDLPTTSNFGGLDASQINRLKSEVSGVLNDVTIDLTSNISNDPEGAKKFLENIIRLQAGILNSNGIRLDYKLNRNGEPQTIQLRTTPRGRQLTYLNDSEDFNHIEHNQQLINQSHSGSGTKAIGATIKLFYNEHVRGLAGRQFLPDSILRTLDGGLSSFTKRFVSQIRKTENDRVLVQSAIDTRLGGDTTNIDIISEKLNSLTTDLSNAVESELAEPVDFNSDIKTTYVNRLIEAGYDPDRRGHRSYFKAAENLDDLHNQFDKDQNYNVGAIQQNIARQEALMRSMVEKVEADGLVGDARNVLVQKIIDIRRFGSRFKTEYKHRQYEAHSIEGLKDLQTISSNLVTDESTIDSLDSRAEKAQSKIDKVKSEMRNGSTNQVSGRQRIAELGKPIELLYRKELLLIWARRSLLTENGQQAPAESEVIKRAQDELNRLTTKIYEDNSRNTSQKIQLLNGVRGRTLDPELALDRVYMRFLKPVTDPTRIAIGTLEQQNKVVFTLQWAEKYAKQLVEMGAAAPIGSVTPEGWSGSRKIGTGQEGTVLSFLEVRDFVQEEMDKIVSVVDAMQTDIWSQMISFSKRNNTVNNVAVWTGNYLSNLGLLNMAGYFAYMGRYLPTRNADGTYEVGEAYQTTRDQFAERLTFSVQENGHINELVQELNDFFLSQGGVSSLEATVNDNDLLEKVVDRIVNLIPSNPVVNENVKIRFSQGFKRLNDLIAEGYGLGDDYAKILPYIMNRELSVAKQMEQTNRDDFEKGNRGDRLYREAVLRKAVPEAIQLTADETFVWSQSPTWVKKIALHRLNPITNSFIMHPVQWLRIISQLHKVQVKQFQELNRVGWNGETEYARLLRSRVLSRGLGLAFTDTSFALTAAGLPALGTAGIAAITSTGQSLGLLDDDEDFDQKSAMTITNITTFNGTQFYTPVPSTLDEKGRFIAADWGRMNVVNTLAPLPQRTDDPSISGALLQIPSKFLGLDKGGNLQRRLNLLTQSEPEDNFGNKLTEKQRIAELTRTFGLYPKYVADAVSNTGVAINLAQSKYRAIYGDGESSEISDPKDISKLAKSVGVRVKQVDPRIELSRLGFELAKDKREKTSLRGLVKSLRTSDEISINQAEDHARMLRLEADGKNGKYKYHFSGLRKWVDSLPDNVKKQYTNAKIRSYLATDFSSGKSTRAGKESISQLLQGKNIFIEDVVSDIDNEIESLQKRINANKSDVQTRENAENAVRSLRLIKARL